MTGMKTSLTPNDIEAFEPAEKVGLVASVNPQGLPHISLITSIQGNSPTQLTLGEFCKGQSKEFIQQKPDIGFLVMTLDKKMWRGKARWTHLKKDGPEFERYNDIPMFRYNTYFGINTVHYLDLIEISNGQPLPMFQIVLAAIFTRIAKSGAKTHHQGRILKPFAEKLFNGLDSLKFISYIGGDGCPVIFPVIQCQAADSRRLSFSPLAFKTELNSIPEGAPVAVFGMTMGMEDVLIRGRFNGFKRIRFLEMGSIDIDWVYNSMPPCHGQIYPELELAPVAGF
jgi:hypothetical protein